MYVENRIYDTSWVAEPSAPFFNAVKHLIPVSSSDKNAFVLNLDIVSFDVFYLVSGYDKAFVYSHK